MGKQARERSYSPSDSVPAPLVAGQRRLESDSLKGASNDSCRIDDQ
jgi:hypothetical protein